MSLFNQIDLKDKDEAAPFTGVLHLKDRDPKYYDLMIKNKVLHDSNFAFVSSTLAKLHETPYEPIWYATWRKDIKGIDIGGGFVDYVEYHTVNWQGIQTQSERLMGNNAGVIPRVNANMTQSIAAVYTYEVAYDLKFVELEKLNKIRFQKSIKEIYQDAISAGWELFIQNIAYTGVTVGGTGLFNNSNVKVYQAPTGVSGGSKFDELTDTEIISFFNGVMAEYLTNTNHNLGMLPDTFLLPIADGRELSDRTSTFFVKSLRNYILDNNFGNDEVKGTDMEPVYNFQIRSRAALDDLGTSSEGRVIVYRNEKRFVRLDMPYPLQSYYTGPNVERGAYTTFFIGQISHIQMPYNDAPDASGLFGPVTYWDLAYADEIEEVLGVYNATITTNVATNDVITIAGKALTCVASAAVVGTSFVAGGTIAQSVTAIVAALAGNMPTGYAVTASTAALVMTQLVGTGTPVPPTVSIVGTGVIGEVCITTSGVAGSGDE